MWCGGGAPLPQARLICRPIGCLGSSSMRFARKKRSISKARRHWSRLTEAGSYLIRAAAAARKAMEMLGQSVIVTGGASGIGKATALLLAREGAKVFVGDIDETGGRAAAAEGAADRLAIEYLP